MSSKPAPPPPPVLSVARLTTLLASLLVALCSGTNYAYSGYAPQLGARLRITHTQLNIIGTAGNLGVYSSGPLWGRIVDTKGPRISLASGFVLLLAGYSGIRFIFNLGAPDVADTISILTFCFLAFCSYISGAGGCGGLTASVNSTARSFPDQARATTTSIVISGFGLSAFLFSTLSRLLFPGDTSKFLLLLALGTATPMIIGFFLIRQIPLPETDSTERSTDPEDRSLLGEDGEVETSSTAPMSRRAALNRGLPPNVHGGMLFRSTDFWLIFTILSMLAGTGLMYINNVGSMAQALYIQNTEVYDPVEAAHWQAHQVSLISLMSFSGRIFTGILSDFLKNQFKLPRSYSMILIAFVFFTSQISAINVDSIQHLWIASVMVGFPYGMTYALFPMVCLEWFGIDHFSENWGYLGLAPMVASPIFSLIFGKNLDAHEIPESVVVASVSGGGPSPEVPLQCKEGIECYVAALYLTAGACALAVLLSVWAVVRDRKKISDGIEASSRRRAKEMRYARLSWEGGHFRD